MHPELGPKASRPPPARPLKLVCLASRSKAKRLADRLVFSLSAADDNIGPADDNNGGDFLRSLIPRLMRLRRRLIRSSRGARNQQRKSGRRAA